MRSYTYLALGDSYTIGELVPIAESFPCQAVQILRKKGIRQHDRQHSFSAPEIIAKTGWTTDELIAAIGQTILLPGYDFVSLLIGVNNQYRGRPVDEFEKEFELLLKMAIQFSGGHADHVFVISIPDWGTTPFAKDRDPAKIALEIDAYNNSCEKISSAYKTHFINITNDQRADSADPSFLASDELHPSGKEYKKWAEKLADAISKKIS